MTQTRDSHRENDEFCPCAECVAKRDAARRERLARPKKSGCIDFSKMTPDGFKQFMIELHSSNS